MTAARRLASPAEPGRATMAADDDEFLDDVFDRALAALTDGRRVDVDEWTTRRPELHAQIEATVALTLEVAAPRVPGFPAVPGYQIVAVLGRGGMGTVFLARQERLGGRLVALKVLGSADALSPRGRARFLDEAKALARLRHEHVVMVHDVVEAPNLCAYAMEWVEGQSLARILDAGPTGSRAGAATPEVFFCRIALQVARALAAVHSAGLVHRDVKPSNVLVREDGRAVLIDFGLARETDATVTAGFAGTLAYAAPEQLTGSDCGPRGDVYGLGATLYHALARRPAFDGSSPASLARAIDAGAPALRRLNPRVSRDLDTIVATAMAADPARRYPTAHAFAGDLERLLSLQPIHARPVGFVTRLVMLVRRNRRAMAGAGAGGVLALVLAGLTIAYALHRAAIPARVRAHVEAARLCLLSAEHGERLFLALHSLESPAASTLDPDAIGRALAEYDAALALAPHDEALRAERETVAYARDFGHGEAAGDPTDRRALGLVAYLRGDAALCSRAWEGLDLGEPGDPLIDAALGELHLQREQAPLAYPRLEAAARAFPRSGFVRVQLAAAALRCGDVGRAGRMLDAAKELSGHDRFDSWTAVRAEWHAARGEVTEARRLFEWMRFFHKTPAVRARYAHWLAAQGEHVASLTVLGEAIALHPGASAFRQQQVALVEQWWGSLDVAARRRWLTELAVRGQESWVLEVLRRYADSVARLASAASSARKAGESAIVAGAAASSGADRQFLLHLVSALEASPVTLARTPSDPPFLRALQVSAWMSPWPALANSCVAHVRRAHRWIQAMALPLVVVASQLGVVSSGKAQGCAYLPPAAVSWWTAEGHAADLLGNNDGVLVNGASFAPGQVGLGFTFDGINDVVQTPLIVSYASGATFEAWIRLTNDRGAVMAGGGASSLDSGMAIIIAPGGHVSAFGTKSTDSVLNFHVVGPPVADGTFHHVALTWTGDSTPSGVSLYVDGELAGTATAAESVASDSQPLNLGGHVTIAYHKLRGVIDEASVYSRALSIGEIAAIYAAGSAGKCRPDLVDATQSTVDASTSLVSAFGGQTTITVTPMNHASGLLAAGQSVILSTTAGTLLGSITDNSDGTYTQVLQATSSAAGAVVSATVNTVAITDTAAVTFVPIDPAQSTITVSPDTTFLGGHATVTVTPKDDQGVAVGSGKTVVLQTTLGTLAGSVTDNNDGTYTQRLDATALGTASITATADGLALTPSASLTVLDSSLGRVIGLRADDNAFPYDTIQQAVNSAQQDQLVRILVNPGTYEELVTVKEKHDLTFEGLSAAGLVTVRGFRVSQSRDLSFAFLAIDASSNARHGLELLGGHHRNERIAMHECTVRGTTDNFDGVRIGRDNVGVALATLWLEANRGDGIALADGPSEVTVTDVVILSSGRNGVRTTDDATVRIASCRIEDSGTRFDDRQGYAIFRQRRHDGGNPAAITLVANTFAGNRGRVVAGKSDVNLGNHDQIVDATDSQPGY